VILIGSSAIINGQQLTDSRLLEECFSHNGRLSVNCCPLIIALSPIEALMPRELAHPFHRPSFCPVQFLEDFLQFFQLRTGFAKLSF
jgi:hypothetical protein